MLAAFTIYLTGFVPVICEIRSQELFCNAPYVLYIDGQEIERGGPTIRELAPLPDGPRYSISVLS